MDKVKLKKFGDLLFKVVGGLSIVFVLLFVIFMISPSLIPVGDDGDADDYNSAYDTSEQTYEEESLLKSDYPSYDNSAASELIKTGNVSLVVDDLDEAMESLNTVKDRFNGTYTYSSKSGEGIDRYVYLTMKIESKDFDEAFLMISDIDGEEEYSNTNTVDVTEQYIDLESRLRNLEAVETQLLEIMDTAETVEDTLNVYTELSSTRSQIEILKGELRYLENQTDYSYITVTFSLSSTGAQISEDEWKPLGIAKDAFRAFVSVLKGFANILIWALVFSPFVLLGLGVYLLVDKRNKNKK